MNRAVLPETTAPDFEFLYLDIGSVGTGVLLKQPTPMHFGSAPSRARRIVRSGDTIISTVRTYLKAVYHIGEHAASLVCSTGFAVLTPLGATVPKFVSYLVQSDAFTNRVVAESVGTVYPAIAETRIASFHVAVPPFPEQTAIVRFLDWADRRIRRVIRAREKRIKLLEEYRQAIIHQAVTGQIDVRTGKPYPAYKDSGVEWLSKVPKHWKVTRLGQIADIVPGFAFKSDSFSRNESDIRLLRGINVAPGQARWESVARWPAADRASFREFELYVGDIVLGLDRPVVAGGVRVAILQDEDVPSLLLQRVARIRIGVNLKAEFLLLIMDGRGFSEYLTPIFTGISVPHVSPEQVGAFRLAHPSVTEQAAILGFASEHATQIDTAIAADRRVIELLKEFRTRLIADVVTGKLDVREATASLPDESEESETANDLDEMIEAEMDQADDPDDQEHHDQEHDDD